METVEVKLQLPKESTELAQATKEFLLEMKKALDDGFQPGMDIPAAIQAAMTKLAPGLQGAGGIKTEASEDALGVGQAFGVMGVELARELMKKPEVAAPAPAPTADAGA